MKILGTNVSTANTWLAPQHVSMVAAIYAIVGGSLSFIGWATGVTGLKDWWGTGIVIKANTAIGITLAGVSLLAIVLFPAPRKTFAYVLIRVAAICTALIGALTLFQHLTGHNLGIDTLVFDEPSGAPATVSPGRMGMPASSSLLVLGISVFLLTIVRSRARTLSAGLALAVLTIAILSLASYWYGAEATMYTLPRLTGIALQTATMIVALSIGIIAAQPDREPMKTFFEDSTAGVLARRIFPAVFVVPLVLGWLRVNGQRVGWFDDAFGTALRTVVEIAILGGLSWWIVKAIRSRDVLQLRAEAERHSGEQRLRSVLDASAVPFTVLAPVKDNSGAIVDFSWIYLNAAAAQAIKMDPQQLIGRCISEVFPGAWSEPGLFDNYAAAVLRKEVREFERHSTTNDIDGWFQVVVSPLDDNVAVWFADVTERKHRELELRRVDQRKDEFLATLAHELRNPLAPIRQAATLAKKLTISETQRQWCNDVIERQVQHMALLLEDLLDVSRITRGILELRKQPTALAAIVESAVETARPLIDARRHTLTLELPDNAVQIDVDPLRMSQVISNLLNNAAKYTNVGGTIHLSATLHGNDFHLTVADNGIGVPKEELGSIFTMFSQVKSAQERSEGGLGIGLSLTKGLVELHGGSIEAESAGPGLGSVFAITLPNARVANSASNTQAPAPPRQIQAKRILLADDNRDAAESLAMLLRIEGHDVTLAHDGEAALTSFVAFSPDIVLLDIGMPLGSGYDVARRIRLENKAALLIAITGWGQSSDREKSAAAGFNHHLTKPVDYGTLHDLIASG